MHVVNGASSLFGRRFGLVRAKMQARVDGPAEAVVLAVVPNREPYFIAGEAK